MGNRDEIKEIFNGFKTKGKQEASHKRLMDLQEAWTEVHPWIEYNDLTEEQRNTIDYALAALPKEGRTHADFIAAMIATDKLFAAVSPGSPIDRFVKMVLQYGKDRYIREVKKFVLGLGKSTYKDAFLGVHRVMNDMKPILRVSDPNWEIPFADVTRRVNALFTNIIQIARHPYPLTIVSSIVKTGGETKDGAIVEAVSLPWLALVDRFVRDPDCLYEFTKHYRAFEEFIAAAYKYEGWDVTLTPRSNDRGRDIIAVHRDLKIRIFDQAKACRKGKRVTANDVRAAYGTAKHFPNVSKTIITTTAEFAPGVYDEYASRIPYEVELRDRDAFIEWLSKIAKMKAQSGLVFLG